MKVYWTRIRATYKRGFEDVYYFTVEGESVTITSKIVRNLNKRRRPKYLFLCSVPYHTKIGFGFLANEFFEIDERYVKSLL